VAGQMLQRQIEAAGVFVRTGRTLESVLGHDAVEGVVLDDGEHLPADLVVVACGVRPRVEVAQASAIPLNHGVLVNDGLATQAPGVYAIGECAEHQGRVYGMLGPAQEQADVLADILSGWDPRARYAGSKPFARLNVPGIEVAALGSVEPQLEHDELLQVLEPRRHTYRKLIVRERKLVGAALVGDTRAAPALLQTYVRGERLPEDPLEALRSASVPVTLRAVDPACTCHGVARDTLLRAISGAAADATNDAEGALGLCPKCRDELERHVGTHREARLRAVSA
jgi:nitrite reductase (NADH) large subunit